MSGIEGLAVKAWVGAALLAAGVAAHATVVTSISSSGFGAANGTWYKQTALTGASYAIVDLSGKGGNLEFSQPLPNSALRLTTNASNGSKVEVSVKDAYGKVGDILSDLTLHYSYFKEDTGSSNLAAAPTLKLSFSGGGSSTTLVYEPYWNEGNGKATMAAWTDVDIDFDTGLFWTTGGYGQSDGKGGPPLKTLSGWLTAFSASFSNANLTTLTFGLGSYNPSQIGYVDDVRISGGNYSASYNFGPEAPIRVPEPGSLALVGLALAGLWAVPRRRKA